MIMIMLRPVKLSRVFYPNLSEMQFENYVYIPDNIQ